MNFKLSLQFMICFLMLSSCTDFLRGRKAKPEVLKMQIADASCSLDFKSKIEKIFKSEASDEEINQNFDCMDQYLSQFQDRVEGQVNPDIYDAQDLLHITGRFFKSFNLTEDHIKKIIVFKQALVGGSDIQLTKKEVTDLKNYLKIVRQETLTLSPYFKLFKASRVEGEISEKFIKLSTEQLKSSLKVLLSHSNFEKTKYSYNDAKALFQALGIFSDPETLNSFDHVRALILGEQSLNFQADYLNFIDNLGDAHNLYLRALYGHLNCEMTSLATTKQTIAYFDDIVNLLETSYQFKKTGRVNTYNIDGIIELLIQKNIFPFRVKFTTFRDFYKIALKKVFQQESFEFVTIKSIETYRKESELFKLEIHFLEQKIKNEGMSLVHVRDRFSDYIEKQSYQQISEKFDQDEKRKIIADLIDLNFDLYNESAIAVKDMKFIISKEAPGLNFSALDLLRSFYIKMLSRQLLKGWGNAHQTVQLLHSELRQDQMISFMKDFDQFGVELKLNDPRSKNDGSKNFLEADLMGFYSDGKNNLSMFETFEYLHYLVAEGSWTVTQIQKDLKARYCETGELDVFGIPYSLEPCFYANLKQNYSKYFENKPGLVRFLSRLSDDQFYEYYSALMDVARFEPRNRYVKIETVDIQNFVVMSGYIEMMLIKYDKDRNESLSPQEIRDAYPKFKTFATDYSYKNAADALAKWDSMLNYCRLVYSKEDLIRESFIFMVLNNGHTPTMSDMNYATCAVKGIFSFNNEVDRRSIINTFFVLKSVLASGK